MNVWLAEIWRAWRASLRRPGFLLLATGVLALGIGSTVAIFTLIDHVLLQPLPYAQPSRLVVVGRTTYGHQVSPIQYQHLQALQGVSSIGVVEASQVPVNVTGGGKPVQVTALDVGHNLLPTLGVTLPLGRNFTLQEDTPNGPRAVILSHGFWERRFGGNAQVIGHAMQLEGKGYTIIGVLPASFGLLGGADLLLPTALPAHSRDGGTNYLAIARMAPGTTVAGLSAEVDARMRAMYASMGGKAAAEHAHVRYVATSLASAMHASSQKVLVLFMACALFVLLIALVNLANLMVLRALARGHDAAVRAALGAPTLRLALPALGEGLLVGLAGAVVGVGLAALVLGLLRGFVPSTWLGQGAFGLGVAAWGVAFAIGLACALLAAALGWWRGRAAIHVDELREGGRSGIGRGGSRLGKALVVVQVALATVLLFGAGLFLHTLYHAAHTSLGFSTRGVLTFAMAPVKATYPDVASVHRLDQQVLTSLREQPGVIAATVATNLPVGGQLNMPVHLSGGQIQSVQYRGVSPGFFASYGIAMRAGRAFARTDSHGAASVAIVNQAYAHQYLDGHALGKTITLAFGNQVVRVVGVVADTRQFGPLQAGPPILYVPMAQVPDKIMGMIRGFLPLRFAVRVHGDAAAYGDRVRAAVAAVAPAQPIADMRTLADVARGITGPVQRNLVLVGLFALLALLLAAAGMYAVMATVVASREREFGVRTALGASPWRLMRLVLRGGLAQIGMGLALGVVAALLLSHFVRTVVQAVGDRSLFDPVNIIGVCVVLAVAGLLACLLPALRAARVQPMHALRGE
ncbi:MAG TPA: ADOP family duplicated permease [Rhodanobacteraceae bacterium]